MQQSPDSSRVVRFGAFELDLHSAELRKQGVRLRLQGQPFQVLSLLLERAGDVVSRDELKARLWAKDTFVDFDRGLNKAVNRIREVLGDSASNARFVETLSRRGYRFLCPVDRSPYRRAAASDQKLRILVLPFHNLNGTADQQYFADGLTEEMISQLGQINPKRIGVIARTSAMQYRSTAKTANEIGQELAVDYILEGSVRRADNRARISTQLVHVSDQTHLWGETYDHELTDLFAVQAEVARKVAHCLLRELLPDVGPNRTNAAVHDIYLQGLFFWNQRGETSLRRAIELFEEALAEDDQFAPAHVGLANCYAMLSWYGAHSPHDAASVAKRAVHRALQLSPRLGDAHCAAALLRFWYDWDWNGAEQQFQTAIELAPSSSTAHLWHASLLAALGRFDEALAQNRRGHALDPLSLILDSAAGDIHYFARSYEQAIAQYVSVLEREPKFAPAYFQLGRVYLQQGLHEAAIAAMREAVQLSGNREAGVALLAHAYAVAGAKDEARKILLQQEQATTSRYRPAPTTALIHAALGDRDKAIEWLCRGLEERSFWMVFLNVDPVYDPLRSHPAFRNVVRQLRLPSARHASHSA